MQVSHSRYLAGIVSSLVAGLVLGATNIVEPSEYLVKLLLYILILSAGFTIGGMWGERGLPSGREALSGVALGLSVMAAGGLAGYAVSLVLGEDPRLATVIGLASGWYSLAGPLVALHDPVLGLVAFLANLLREILHISIYPVLAVRGWPCRGVSVGGATTMDTGLPVVVKFGGSRAALLALSQGAIITMIAPLAALSLLNG
ncbi:MAG: lysine exporter LysO family protein [Desulfurococcales archaeon]|nr:lysine exporter LysO family protein [Desulfurococcales archaeon]